jgi:hypothetical protein
MPDIISEYAFGRSYHRLEQADFDPHLRAVHARRGFPSGL